MEIQVILRERKRERKLFNHSCICLDFTNPKQIQGSCIQSSIVSIHSTVKGFIPNQNRLTASPMTP